MRDIRVAVIGAGPAGIYASDILVDEYPQARVDLFDRLPALYGLVRYGVVRLTIPGSRRSSRRSGACSPATRSASSAMCTTAPT